MQGHEWLNKRPMKAALMYASKVVPLSGHFMNHKNLVTRRLVRLSQSPTQMVAHGELTSSHRIIEVNSCVEVLGKTSHTIPHLSTQQ